MLAKKGRTRDSRNPKPNDRSGVANDALNRFAILTSEFDRTSAEAEAIGQKVREHLAAEEAKYNVDEKTKPPRNTAR